MSQKPISLALFVGAILAATVVSGFLRFPDLDQRPMHTDEAVQAVKSGILWESGVYEYDPQAYHGPTLYYLTQPFLWLSKAQNFSQTSEAVFRTVPAFFSVATVLLCLGVGGMLGRGGAIWAAWLMALSPAQVFYGRYYIQESLLVFFTFGFLLFGHSYVLSQSKPRKPILALAAGLCLGLMHATKETSVLVLMILVMAIMVSHKGRKIILPGRKDLGLGLGSFGIVSAAFHTSFFTRFSGLGDALRSYSSLWNTALDGGLHEHSGFFYISTYFWSPRTSGGLWTEALILILFLAGICLIFVNQASTVRTPKILALTGLGLFFIYSMVPYKTPWSVLGAMHLWILVAGWAASRGLSLLRPVASRILTGILVLGLVHLGTQAYGMSRKYNSDRRNPHVYAASVVDIQRLEKRVRELSRISEPVKLMTQVMAPDYWPLPWVLRSQKQTGYWKSKAEKIQGDLLVVSPEIYSQLEPGIREKYQTEYYGLRPDVIVLLCIKKDLWAKYLESLT